MKNFTTTFIALALSMGMMSVSAADFGYSNGDAGRNSACRVGSTELQGMAIKINGEKLQALKGSTISSIKTAFGSSRTNNGEATLFITSSLDGDPIMNQTVSITKAATWLEFKLDNPYTITGEEDCLYVGVTGEINNKGTMLSTDRTEPFQGLCFFYDDGQWLDAFDYDFGNPNVMVVINDAPEFTDLILKPMELHGYYKAAEEYTFTSSVFNFGDQTVDSFDAVVTIGNDAPTTYSFESLNLAPHGIYSFEIAGLTSSLPGDKAFEIAIENINSKQDLDASDNVYSSNIFYYPSDMERALFYEGYTGQECSNCPAGHRTAHAFIESLDVPVIEVMHHAGYQPDQFTMMVDAECTMFYGSNSTYAPAFNLNRATVPANGVVPIANVTNACLRNAYERVMKQQPYVSLGLDTKYDPETRMVDVTFSMYTHNDMPEGDIAFNIYLVQDSLWAYQSGGGNSYNHMNVCRGAITENNWGYLLPEHAKVQGGELTWSTQFELPEGIFSDYYNPVGMAEAVLAYYTVPTVAENMHFVAYVGEYGGNNINGYRVYNAVEAKLGESYNQGGLAGIDNVITAEEPLVIKVVDGRVVVEGNCDSLNVYDINGRVLNANTTLSKGIYLVKAVSGQRQSVKKVFVK